MTDTLTPPETPTRGTAAPTDYLTDAQVRQLLAGIRPSRVSHKQGQSHLEAYDVRAHLNRIFGFCRWDGEVLDHTLLFEEVYGEKTPKANGNGWDDSRKITVGYRVRYRLVVRAPDGTTLARYTEVATGDATNFPGSKRADAHDFAVKTAESQAFKRCAINLGDQFGLSLYAGGRTDPIVLGTLVGQPPADQPPAGQVDAAAPAVVPEQEPPAENATADDPAEAGVDPATGEVPPDNPKPDDGELLVKDSTPDPEGECRDTAARKGVVNSLTRLGLTPAEVAELFGRPVPKVATKRLSALVRRAIAEQRQVQPTTGAQS